MTKRILTLLLALVLFAGCFVACKEKEETPDVDESESVDNLDESDSESSDEGGKSDDGEGENMQVKTFKITLSTPGVKVLGVRSLASESGLHMDWSCSGAEFGIDLKGDTVRLNFKVSASCYMRIWVDGKEYKQNGSEYFTVSMLSSSIVLDDIPTGKHTIRIMKVTGYTLARAELVGIMFAGSLLTDAVDTSDKDIYIEFVGDSITCAWGTIGEHGGAYTDQDGTLAYSYLLAEKLNADYSMTALSGQGLLYGTPGVTNGYLYADPIGNSEVQYNFARKADIVVINIGTNDCYQKVGEAEFKTAYLSFLKTVREKNGDSCKILCLYNAMNDTYSNAILAAVEEFGGEFNGVSVYKLDRAYNNQHPNISEHEAYAETLKEIIVDLPGKYVPDITVLPSGDGSDNSIDMSQMS